jgi:hypothetical protein
MKEALLLANSIPSKKTTTLPYSRPWQLDRSPVDDRCVEVVAREPI